MAKLIREVRRPHDCLGELMAELGHMDLWPGSIADCSCGKRYVLNDSQREGLEWVIRSVYNSPDGSQSEPGPRRELLGYEWRDRHADVTRLLHPDDVRIVYSDPDGADEGRAV